MTQPGLLIASPQMRDVNFSDTVVLLWHYSDEGAMGVVINRGTSIPIEEVLEQLDIPPSEERESADRVLIGGPVEPNSGYLLFRGEVPEDEGWNLPRGIAVTTSQARLEKVLQSTADYVLCLGYAGWGPGQLDREIQTGSWLYAEIDDHLVFDEPLSDRYRLALASLGLTAEQVWMTPIDE